MDAAELRKLDAEVFRVVFGGVVVGEAACWAPDGCWSVRLPHDGEDLDGYDSCEIRPVYQETTPDPWADEEREFVRRPKLNGVTDLALAPVPWYSTKIEDAWKVVERMHEATGWRLNLRWSDARSAWMVDTGRQCEHIESESATLAICYAALSVLNAQTQ